jgi:hypothetical protein
MIQQYFSFIIVGNSIEAETENGNATLHSIRMDSNDEVPFVNIESGLYRIKAGFIIDLSRQQAICKTKVTLINSYIHSKIFDYS